MGYRDIDPKHLGELGRTLGAWLRDGDKDAYLD